MPGIRASGTGPEARPASFLSAVQTAITTSMYNESGVLMPAEGLTGARIFY